MIVLLRFSIGEGAAGHVAKTGKSINITDAYRSKHFSSRIDQEVRRCIDINFFHLIFLSRLAIEPRPFSVFQLL